LSGEQERGESRAAATEVVLHECERTISLVRANLTHVRCQLPWRPSTMGRMLSLAALSHQCVYLEQLEISVRKELPSYTNGLLSRHHFETWLTGMYLLVGGEEALKEFLGDARRAYQAQQKEVRELQAKGSYIPSEPDPFGDFDWEPRRWSYETAIRELDRFGTESSLLRGVKEVYTAVYRTLSGVLGGHPTYRLLERYIDTTTSKAFARVEPTAEQPMFRAGALQWSLVLTATHAQFAFAERGLTTEDFVAVVNSLTPEPPSERE
jgi:hypothetical protein